MFLGSDSLDVFDFPPQTAQTDVPVVRYQDRDIIDPGTGIGRIQGIVHCNVLCVNGNGCKLAVRVVEAEREPVDGCRMSVNKSMGNLTGRSFRTLRGGHRSGLCVHGKDRI